jgi:lipoate-protein ligase B
VAEPLEVQSRPFRAGELDVLRLGRAPFDAVRALEELLVERRAAREACDTLLLCEHDPVVTVGHGSSLKGLEQTAIPIVELEFTAEPAFYAPGQLFASLLIELPEAHGDLRRFQRSLEQVVLGALGEVEVTGERRPGSSGVWVKDRLLSSIGVTGWRGVTVGRIALNLHADLAALEPFTSLGLDPARMANVEEFSELPARSLLFEVLLVKHVCEVFELELPPIPPPPPPGLLPIFPGPH